MRVIFQNGEIADLDNVLRIILDGERGIEMLSGLKPIMREEYARGFKDGYKTGIMDYKVKGKGAVDIVGEDE